MLFKGCIDFESGKNRTNNESNKSTSSTAKKKSTLKLSSSTGLDSYFVDLDKKKAATINDQLHKEHDIQVTSKTTPLKQAQKPIKKPSTSLNFSSNTNFDSFLSEFDSKPKTSKQAVAATDDDSKKKQTPTKKSTPIDKYSFMRAIEESDESEVDEPVVSATAAAKPVVTGVKKKQPSKPSSGKEKADVSFKLPNSSKSAKKFVRNERSKDEERDSDPDYEQLDGLSDTSSVEYETDDDEDSLDLYGKRKRKKYNLIIRTV